MLVLCQGLCHGMDAINKSTFLAVGMQLWKVLVFGAVQGKKHIGLWKGNKTI
jgi:hypothetical protein